MLQSKIKKWYTDMRYGSAVATPIFSYSSFVLIAYNFTQASIIPFPIFAAGFTGGLIVMFITIGGVFRTKQLSTDQDLLYQQQKELIRTQRITLEAIQSLMNEGDKKTEVLERIQYLKKLETH